MKVFIFAIGGTGARALRALSFCLASGMYDVSKDTEFVPIIIDYDATNGDKTRAREALEDYMSIHDAAYEMKDIEIKPEYRNFFLPRVSYLQDVATRDGRASNLGRTFEFTFNGATSDTKGTFAEYLGLQNMTGDKYLTADLLKALYNDADVTDPDYAYTELNLDLSVGFKGNPNIGTVVFDKLSASPEYKVFEQSFVPGEDRAFIIGSIFGGTGSSGIPQLIKALRNNSITGWNNAAVGAAIVMPYFKVDTPATGGAVNSNIFKSKQKAALDYYLQRKGELNLSASYYIAEQDALQTTLEYHEGDDSQRNNAHIVELLTALSILDFTKTDKSSFRGDSMEFGLKNDFGGRQDPLQLKNFGEATKTLFLDPLVRFGLAGKYFKDYLCTNKRDNSLAYINAMALTDKLSAGLYATYNSFIIKMFDWLKEMNLQEHPFYPLLVEAENLDTMVSGFKDDSGFLSDNADYKGFNAICNTQYNKHFGKDSNINRNKLQLFIKLLYETSIKIYEKYKAKK